MIIGVPKEIKNQEHRVALTPQATYEVVRQGHSVKIEAGAGIGSGITDKDYLKAGAQCLASAEEVFSQADLIVKVKEPQAVERKRLREGQLLFTYLHLAPDPEQTRDLVDSGAVCIAYETVTHARGGLPLLKPMSQIAGRMSIQAGAHALEKTQKGRGVLLGGVPGVPPGKVLIIGGGVAGSNAAEMAVGLQADVTILDRNPHVLEQLSLHLGNKAKVLYSTQSLLEDMVLEADLVIGSVLIPGAASPKLMTKALVSSMKKGAVFVDISVDQGGCSETTRPTTHDQPTYEYEDVVHYCVANIPGGVARTSTYALSYATLPYLLAIANKGWGIALSEDPHLLAGLNIAHGKVTHQVVAQHLGYPYTSPQSLLISNKNP